MGSILPPNPARGFVDTSVLFAGSLSISGFVRDMILAGMHGRLDLIVSQFVLLETRRNLASKGPHAIPFLETFLAIDAVRSVELPIPLVHRAATAVALKDAPVLAAAVYAGVVALATYDCRHLLARSPLIRATFGVTVETLEVVLKRIG